MATSGFGDEHPDCEVVGADLSPIQSSCVQPNLKLKALLIAMGCRYLVCRVKLMTVRNAGHMRLAP